MACKRAATCRARFARGELACVRCAEGRLDIGDVEDLDDEEEELPDEECNLDDDEELDDDDDDDVAFTAQSDGVLGDLTSILTPIVVKGHDVRGIRVDVTIDGRTDEYVVVVESNFGEIPEFVVDDIDDEVDYYASPDQTLYSVLEEVIGRAVEHE